MAKRSRGGTYPDQAVDERKNMALFFCAVLCLLPTGFTTKLPVGSVPADRHIAAYPLNHVNVSANAYLYTEWIHCQTHIFCKLGCFIASALVIPLVHYTCVYLRRRFSVSVKFLHRLTAGQITMIISAALYMITTHGYNYEISLRVLLAPSVFLGISNALVYAVVYEMNLVISPRSMQCTSMGMFRFLDGAGSLINLIAAYSSYASNIDYFLGSGIATIVIGMTMIIILEKKVGVGLTRV